MSKQEFLKRALDSNAFDSANAEAVKVNPNIWERELREHVKANLVVAGLGEVIDFTQPGVDYTVTIDQTPTAMGSVAEDADASIDALSFAQVTFTPTEYSRAYQLTDKEARRAFFDVASNMSQKLGYAYALAWNTEAVDELIANAGSTVLPAGRAAITDIESDDALAFEQVNDGVLAIEDSDLTATEIVIPPIGKRDLLNDTNGRFTDASAYGSREAILNGNVGRFSGLDVYQTTIIPTVSSSETVAQGLILGRTNSGESSFASAVKAPIQIRTQYNALGRYTDIVGSGEFDVKVKRSEGVVLLQFAG